MRSVQLVGPRTLEVQEVPLPPEPGPGEALVRVRAVGICGSDLHWYWDGRIGRRSMVYPQVLGHEAAGEVAAAGPGCPFKAGARVFVEPAMHCGACEFCRAGKLNLCPGTRFMGSTPVPGLLCDYRLAPAANLVAIPDHMDFAGATLLEPLAIILHVLDLVPVRMGDVVAVAGAGPIGLLMIAAARAAGARRIFASEKVSGRLALARAVGADVTVDARTESLADAVLAETGGHGADAAFEAAGDCDGTAEVLRATRGGGAVALIGLSSRTEMPFDIDSILVRELKVVGIRRSNHNTHAALGMLAAGRIPGGLVTHLFGIEQAPEAFRQLAAYEGGPGKVVIEVA